MPVLRKRDRGLQDCPPDLRGSSGSRVERLEGLLEQVEGLVSFRHFERIVRIAEPVEIVAAEDRSEREGGLDTQVGGFLLGPQYPHQGLDPAIPDDGDLSGKPHRHDAVVVGRSSIA